MHSRYILCNSYNNIKYISSIQLRCFFKYSNTKIYPNILSTKKHKNNGLQSYVSRDKSSSNFSEFGVDSGPQLDIKAKMENQQRVVNKERTSYRSVFLAICGNSAITIIKFIAAASTQSPVLLSEAIHTLADTINQLLLLIGLFRSRKPPDNIHHHGYTRSAYLYSFISGFGMFALGSIYVMYNAIIQLNNLDTVIEYGLITWGTLGIAFILDGSVLLSAIRGANRDKDKNETLWNYIKNTKDPYLRAVLLEDSVAMIGVLAAVTGVGLSHLTGNAMWDPISSCFVSILLGTVAASLIKMNGDFLLSKAIDPKIQEEIKKYLLSRDALRDVDSIETAWEGPVSFSFKADIDFNGSYIASLLLSKYHDKLQAANKEDLPKLLIAYTEDVAKEIEREVYHARMGIAERYPEAKFIDLQPFCKLETTPEEINILKKE